MVAVAAIVYLVWYMTVGTYHAATEEVAAVLKDYKMRVADYMTLHHKYSFCFF